MSATGQDRPAVVRNAAAQRFELTVDGHVGVLEYHLVSDRLLLQHTDVPAALQGHGYANDLARAGLDYAAREQLRVVPQCPFVRAYLKRHPELLPLVDERWRKEVE